MFPKPTLQSLPNECLLEIVQYLPFVECVFLRSLCASLKHAVDEHFRKYIRTLPVMLSDRYSAEDVDKFQQYCENSKTQNFQMISFGPTSGVSQWNLFDDEEMVNLDRIQHFRRNNYLILTNMAKFDVFVDFATKYLPNITKLALVIDHPEQIHNIPKTLNIYRKQLKVLLLEATRRAMIKFDVYSDHYGRVFPAVGQSFDFTQELYNSIDGLEALEELYFFTKCNLTFSLGWDRRSNSQRFVENMLRKLRILHMNCDGTGVNYPPFHFEFGVYEKLEELGCHSSFSLRESRINFPLLKKFTFFGRGLPQEHRLDSNLLPGLSDISLPNSSLTIDHVMKVLNNLPSLKRIHCLGISLYISSSANRSNNKTVEFIEVDELSEEPKDSMEIAMQKARTYLGFFSNLKKVVFREPAMELTGSDLQRFLAGDFSNHQ